MPVVSETDTVVVILWKVLANWLTAWLGRYCITGGIKFGSDFLIYPGDPSLYHAQFCAHVEALDTVLNPTILAGTARGTHAARKHLLYVTEV